MVGFICTSVTGKDSAQVPPRADRHFRRPGLLNRAASSVDAIRFRTWPHSAGAEKYLASARNGNQHPSRSKRAGTRHPAPDRTPLESHPFDQGRPGEVLIGSADLRASLDSRCTRDALQVAEVTTSAHAMRTGPEPRPHRYGVPDGSGGSSAGQAKVAEGTVQVVMPSVF